MPDRATIDSIVDITPGVRQYTVRLNEGEFNGLPGQHTVIRIPEGHENSGTPRAYSVLSIKADEVVLMIRSYDEGTVSKYMSERSVGDNILVESELTGYLTLQSTERDVVFISTGTGIAPMIGMLHEYLENGEGSVTFMYGEKTEEQLMYREMLEQFEHTHNLRTKMCLSRESWDGYEGYIQEHIDDVFDEFDVSRDYYVCGVPQMVVDTKQQLKSLGVPQERIHSEGWEEQEV